MFPSITLCKIEQDVDKKKRHKCLPLCYNFFSIVAFNDRGLPMEFFPSTSTQYSIHGDAVTVSPLLLSKDDIIAANGKSFLASNAGSKNSDICSGRGFTKNSWHMAMNIFFLHEQTCTVSDCNTTLQWKLYALCK